MEISYFKKQLLLYVAHDSTQSVDVFTECVYALFYYS